MEPTPHGHVIAVRITSENPDEGFKPSAGETTYKLYCKVLLLLCAGVALNAGLIDRHLVIIYVCFIAE